MSTDQQMQSGNTYGAGFLDGGDNIASENSITNALQGVQPHQFLLIIGKRISALLVIVVPELDNFEWNTSSCRLFSLQGTIISELQKEQTIGTGN